jgi:predicted transposase/invertase (TIGR01784 family)
MGSTGKNPHNALVIDTFTHVERASGLLGALLPSEITRHLDLTTLTLSQDHLVDEKLRETETDILYRVSTRGGGEAFVYVLLEHQSTADSWMPFRLLKYMVRIWDRWHRSEGDAGGTLPPIVPVVLSHAPSGWNTARDLIELIDGPAELVDALRPHLPGFEPVIEDLARRSDEELEAMTLDALTRLVFLLLKHVRDGEIAARLPRWAETFHAVARSSGVDALVRVLMYIFECVENVSLDDLRWVDEAVEAPAGEVTMTLAERLRQEGWQKGRQEGRQELLLKQLRLRFGLLPPSAEHRVAEASPSDVEQMAERVLTATSLDEVLDLSR